MLGFALQELSSLSMPKIDAPCNKNWVIAAQRRALSTLCRLDIKSGGPSI